ncbi:conserved hypothetical protein [Pirellula staleyi DSM 6068]|uniref:VWFA domain-containing protein n=1 Tax=Pirellula staleyi (strain ATCC 27377 / DSM 6068 / ICPB 4128) TaxID=530564 RepID=D2QX48_PIRSD|nr:BatA domain-containing protein [Pirellula staleyi]ADB17888.1 conserved hypothetical protein [Pirellula staleyi DSM 6068]
MQFVHQALTWGFLLALVPLLIHLINMMRHRRVKWAAMEFLLAGYKKHRKWVWLKQLLLLLSRMAAVALLVAMLAQLKTQDQWLQLFGGQVTHHYVLVDDSYSMEDRVAGASALDAAKSVLRSIVEEAQQQDTAQRLTVIRYSQARDFSSAAKATSSPAIDFNAETINSDFAVTLEKQSRTIEPTQLSLSPLGAIAMVKQLVTSSRDENALIYLLSDFRERDWKSPADVRAALEGLKSSRTELHLVNCARESQPNLGIVAIQPADETRAAGVPLFVYVRVKNFGTTAVSKVQLKIESTFYAAADVATTPPEQLTGQVDELATLLLEKIEPGETISRRVQVYFPQPGKHVVSATLPEDPVASDNKHFSVIDFPDGERVLVVDGHEEAENAYYLEAAFRPLEKSNTGVRPEVKPAAFLRDAKAETLAPYSAIYLLDVDRLDNSAVELLETYVRTGGGLAIFAGPKNNVDFYSRTLYRDGTGLLPAPLGLEQQLAPAIDSATPDIELTRHPIFSFFVEETNPLIRGVRIDQYRAVQKGFAPTAENPVEIIAKLRNGSPLVLEKKVGEGTVIQVMTTLNPEWNDWAKNPSFVVVMLKLQSYLAAPARLDDPRLVGSPLRLALDANAYRSDVTFVIPGKTATGRSRIDLQLEADEKTPAIATAAIGLPGTAVSGVRQTDRAGIYEALPVTTKGEIDLRRYSVNVDPLEGDLATTPPEDLVERLDGIAFNYHLADQYQQQSLGEPGYNWSMLLLGLLVLLLLAEQFLAYSASYHPILGGAR